MKKLISLLLVVLALMLPLCTGYASAENYGELDIDWQPESLGDDPDAPEYGNVYVDPAEAYAADDQGSWDENSYENEPQDSGEIDWSEYAAAAMDLDGAQDSTADGTTPYTRRGNETTASAADSHYYTAAALDVSISDQKGNTCWAVAAMDSLMIGARKDGQNISTLDPDALVYYAYHGFTDSLCNSGRDYLERADGKTEVRGNVYASLMTLASWAGASASLDTSLDKDIYSSNELWLENGSWLSLAGSEDRTAVKNAIFQYGSVAASLYFDATLLNDYYNDETYAYCYTGAVRSSNHQVVIVGWDDDYPAINFRKAPTNEDGEMLNGAWLCRNSWGSGWGDGGYFWLSYHDAALCGKGVALALEASNWGRDMNLYQYDCNYTLYSREPFSSESATIANVYTAGASDSEQLRAVGTYSLVPGTKYTVTVYVGLTDESDPTSGYPIIEASGNFDYAGYHSFPLDNQVYLEKGTRFSVVFKLSVPGAEKIYLPVCKSYSNREVSGVSFNAYNSANAGESFCLKDGKWTDRSAAEHINYRIKAYTSSDNATHTHEWETVSTPVPPECTKGGIAVDQCSCGALRKRDLDPTGHTPAEIPAVAATCTAKGRTAGEMCSVCETILVPQEETDALGHAWDEGKVTTKPTCTGKGVKTYTCSVCSETRTEDIAPTGHKLEKIAAAAATSVAAGNTEHWKCSVCGSCFGDEAGTMPLDADDVRIPAKGFDDVVKGSYYEAAVQWAVEESVTAGATATTFDPKGKCSRAQIVTFLWRAAGEPEPKSSEGPFTDIKEGSYYYKAVLWAAEEGITAGTTATKFSPDRACTRGQVVTFLWRYFGMPEATSTDNRFTDVPSDLYYYKAVLWAVENSVTAGMSSTSFSPNIYCTRAQAVTFLYRSYSPGK